VDDYIRFTLLGVKPDIAQEPLRSLQDPETYEVRMTMYYYMNDQYGVHFDYNYTEGDKCTIGYATPNWCMTENMANATYRAFNYPHQVATYYAMYRVAKYHSNLQTIREYGFYLDMAYKTTLKIGRGGPGLMDGTVFREVLIALKLEASLGNDTFAEYAALLEDKMHARATNWAKQPYPYGSEFAFDSTGQEEVVIWLSYFGMYEDANKTVNHILSYMRASATWAYNGGARSLGDLGNNGKWFVTADAGFSPRGLMHYRSGLNMIPLIEWYRTFPDEFLLLEIAMGAMAGQMSNINRRGETSMMFHALPYVLDHDPHSGDYGLGFFGHSLESAAYFVNHPTFGPVCYLCDTAPFPVPTNSTLVTIFPRDSYRARVFVEPLAYYFVAQSGTIANVVVDFKAKSIAVQFDDAAAGYEGGSVREKLFTHFHVQVSKESFLRPGRNLRLVSPREHQVLAPGLYKFLARGANHVATFAYD